MLKIRHLILFTFTVISIAAKSQFSRGDRLIGGVVTASGSNNNYTTIPNPPSVTTSVNTALMPRYSWVNKNNMMNGIMLSGGYSRVKTPMGSDNDQISNNYNFGVGYFIRSFKDFSQQFGWFVEYNALVNYSSTKNKYSSPSNTTSNKYSGVSAGLNVIPGLYYKVSPKVVFEAAFGGVGANYYTTTSSGSKNKIFNVVLNFPSNFTFGLQILLGSKQSNKS